MLQLKVPKIAFVCTHNSCRSQIAEALGKKFADGVFESYSAGTEPKDHINPDAVRLIKTQYRIDMELTQHPKLLQELPPVTVVITMGCGVKCPILPCSYREDWNLEDPTGKSDDDFMEVIQKIEKKVLELKKRIQNKEIHV